MRQKIETPISYNIVTRGVVDNAVRFIQNLPIDLINPIQILIQEIPKKRKMSLNQAMWAGPLADFEREGYIEGNKYMADIWHEYFKKLYLPDENSEGFNPSHVLPGYRKYDITPDGDRVLIGSTTQLTDIGMIIYLKQIEVFAGTIGLKLTTRLEPTGRVR